MGFTFYVPLRICLLAVTPPAMGPHSCGCPPSIVGVACQPYCVEASLSPPVKFGLSFQCNGRLTEARSLCHVSLALDPQNSAAVDILAQAQVLCKTFFHRRVDGLSPTAREHSIDRNVQKRDRKSQRRKIHPG